jgi:hypothetical protein
MARWVPTAAIMGRWSLVDSRACYNTRGREKGYEWVKLKNGAREVMLTEERVVT